MAAASKRNLIRQEFSSSSRTSEATSGRVAIRGPLFFVMAAKAATQASLQLCLDLKYRRSLKGQLINQKCKSDVCLGGRLRGHDELESWASIVNAPNRVLSACGCNKMMNIFYHDRITIGLAEVEKALEKLSFGDAKRALGALAEVRSLVNTTYELSKHAEHLWSDDREGWEPGAAPINPTTGQQYTYVDQWAARYELVRRELVRKFENGYAIELVAPSNALE
jgi:hypothetical protein